MQIWTSAYTITGPARKENQDAAVLPGRILFGSEASLSLRWNVPADGMFSCAVVDGMGGYAGGADAALLTAFALGDAALHDAEQTNACTNTLSEKIRAAGTAWNMPDMGAAFALLTFCAEGGTTATDSKGGIGSTASADSSDIADQDDAIGVSTGGNTPLRKTSEVDTAGFGVVRVANVGDARAYAVYDGYLGLLSEDDRIPSGGSGITQSLGGPSALLDAHFYEKRLTGRNRFLLCTDGVWELLGDAELARICLKHPEPGEGMQAVADIIAACNAYATDNCTALLVDALSRDASGR